MKYLDKRVRAPQTVPSEGHASPFKIARPAPKDLHVHAVVRRSSAAVHAKVANVSLAPRYGWRSGVIEQVSDETDCARRRRNPRQRTESRISGGRQLVVDARRSAPGFRRRATLRAGHEPDQRCIPDRQTSDGCDSEIHERRVLTRSHRGWSHRGSCSLKISAQRSTHSLQIAISGFEPAATSPRTLSFGYPQNEQPIRTAAVSAGSSSSVTRRVPERQPPEPLAAISRE
jgi:hypothetical protein